MTFLQRLGLTVPIIQAPMAGVSTPELAAAVSNAGGLGSIAVGATDTGGARSMIEALKRRTDRAFNVNLFVHKAPRHDALRTTTWIKALEPQFREFGSAPPAELRTIYKSFADDDGMLDLLADQAPPVVSFHFGLPDERRVSKLKQADCVLISTATSFAA
jgi:nitronate monooxygenase